MKAGAFGVEPAPRGTPVDLTGLSCRFSEIATERGVVLSLIVVPGASATKPGSRTVADILELAEGGAEVGRPMPAGGPGLRWPPEGLDLEARAVAARGRWRWAALLAVGLRSLGAYLVFRTGLPIGRFDPARYRRQLVENTDFRKFDDGLRMTLDCTPSACRSSGGDACRRRARRDRALRHAPPDLGLDDLLRARGHAQRPCPFRRWCNGRLCGRRPHPEGGVAVLNGVASGPIPLDRTDPETIRRCGSARLHPAPAPRPGPTAGAPLSTDPE